MDRLTALGTLTAAADDRILEGLLLPYNAPGRTNVGRVVVNPGTVRVPDRLDTLACGLDHFDGREPVADFLEVRDTPEGLRARWRVRETHGGDRLLAEYASGKRRGVSVELRPFAIRDGVLAAGELVGNSFPERPAFDTATLAASMAPDLGTLAADYATESVTTDTSTYTDEETGEEVTVVTTRRLVEEATVTESRESDGDEQDTDEPTEGDEEQDTEATEAEDDEEEPTVTTPTLAAGAARRAGTRRPAPKAAQAAEPQTMADAFTLLASAHRSVDPAEAQRTLTAALSDVVAGTAANGTHARTNAPAWLGELWSGREYVRRFVALMNPRPLTGLKARGWRFVTKPVVGDYAGDKAAIPSNTVEVEEAIANAQRIAGGWDIDRAFFDFGDSEFLASFFQAAREDYARKTDAKAAAALLTAAAANPTTAETVPDGVGAGWAAVVDGAVAILDTAVADYAVVGRGLYRDMLLTRNDDTLAYLDAALNLEDGTMGSFKLVPGPATMDPATVAVGARGAVSWFELGETPIRVDAENIANGGKDTGLFGYWSTLVEEGDAITLVDTDPGV